MESATHGCGCGCGVTMVVRGLDARSRMGGQMLLAILAIVIGQERPEACVRIYQIVFGKRVDHQLAYRMLQKKTIF